MIKTKAIKTFISYAHEDEIYKNKLLTFLYPLKAKGVLDYWEASQILIGSKWHKEILFQLERAELFLLLVSSASIASQYINDIELKRAFEKQEEGKVIIVPVIIRPCNWKVSKINEFHAVPIGGKAITLWENEDLAYQTIVQQIEKLVLSITSSSSVNKTTSPKPKKNLKKQAQKKVIQKNVYKKAINTELFFGNVNKVILPNTPSKNKK